MSIVSFRCITTKSLFIGRRVRRFQDIQRVAMRKLAMLDAAVRLKDLRIPPANRLEPLRADRAGQHSIRVNDQYRLCFTWTDAGPADVELCDYH
ncbi:type II toxin-antitoxin system RelE/ParE family toxin [Stenotrophomonas sp.]|uniref:type II toxin-antitoxin system RelE/ParE family toxin n=1 Tax=Stenotrophomonas sp. TaxID=69392 RepID=UPI00289B235E|nr:type II toxin-antitoxin system RelE/ParE family toxin [Stenotrophomonas sp.]